MRFDKLDQVVKAPDGLKNPLYSLTKAVVKAMKMKQDLMGNKDEVLLKAAKMNAKNRHFTMPADNKACYTDHIIQGKFHCLEIGEVQRRSNAVLFVFGGGMILGSDSGDVGLSRKIGKITDSDVWFPYYPMCHDYDMLENVKMVFECYEKMLDHYKPENIVFLGFSSGASLIMDIITYINELNDGGQTIPVPGLSYLYHREVFL